MKWIAFPPRVLAGVGLWAAVMCLVAACAGTPPAGDGPAPAVGADAGGVPGVEPLPPAPEYALPPPPPARSEEALWEAAVVRADDFAGLVRQDVADTGDLPIPAEVTATAPPATDSAPKQAAVRPAPAPSAPAAPAPVRRPTSAGPAEPAPREEPVAAPAGASAPAAVIPSVRVAQKYSRDNGLPSNRITAIYVNDQDAWIGTADAGVARLNFDEGNWIITKQEDGLASNRVTAITQYKGRVFVGTQSGLSVWDGIAWTTQTEFENVKFLNPVFRVHDGQLWVAARAMYGGLVTFDGERWKDRSTIRPGTVLNNISDFVFSGDNVLWIGTTSRGLYRFDGREWASFTVADGIASNFVYTLDVRGTTCFLGGCCGVSAYENGEWRIYDIAEGLPHSTVNAIAVDGGLVWFGSKKGLAVFDGFEFVNFFTEHGLTDNRITSLFVKGDDLWVGTAEGLNRLSKGY